MQCLGKHLQGNNIRMCLNDFSGFLFRAQPSLMTLESSATIMDAIFASPDEETRGRLLRIMQEFLVSEAAKHSAKEKGAIFPICRIPHRNLHYQQRMPKAKQRTVMSIWKNLLETQTDSQIRGMSSAMLNRTILTMCSSSVSSAIVQRYLSPILEAALSQHVTIQAVAIDVLSFTIKQGLAHPLQVRSLPNEKVYLLTLFIVFPCDCGPRNKCKCTAECTG